MKTRKLGLSLVAAALAGCAGRVAVERPDIALPASYEQGTLDAGDAGIASDWWREFGSPQLTRWIEGSLDANPDIAIAAERLRQAEFALQVAGSSRLPSLRTSLGSTRGGGEDDEGVATAERLSTSAGLSVGWELDLWGRIAADVRGARATLDATRYDYDALRLSTAAAIASTYFQLLSIDERWQIARDNLAIAERVQRIVEARYRNGVATALDVTQQATTVLAQRTALLPFEVQSQQTRTALALLLGEVPQGFDAGGESFDVPTVPVVAPGLPSTLLARRPDIAAAEADLAAAAASVGVARTAFLPSISLSGSDGLGTAELLSLTNPATSWSMGLSLALEVFNGGRLRAQAASARSQQRAVVESYSAAVRAALKEVDDGLGNAGLSARQEATQQETVATARRALELAELQYREGVSDLLTVLDSQRVLFSAQDQLAAARLARLNAALDLYLALGGGWSRS